MAINDPTTTLNYGFVLFKQKQIQALYAALCTWLSTHPPVAGTEDELDGDEDRGDDYWKDAKGRSYTSDPQGDEDYNLLAYFLHKSGFGSDIAHVQVKDEKFHWDDDEVGSPEEEAKKLKAIGIIYVPEGHNEKHLIRKDATTDECGYTSIEFVPLGEAYFVKARERLNAFLNDPVIQAVKLKVKFGMVSSMDTVLGR